MCMRSDMVSIPLVACDRWREAFRWGLLMSLNVWASALLYWRRGRDKILESINVTPLDRLERWIYEKR